MSEDDHLELLRESLQERLPNEDDDDELGVLTGYVVVAQWSAPDGTEWITHTAGNINDDGPSIWTVEGWLWHALHAQERDAVEDDDA